MAAVQRAAFMPFQPGPRPRRRVRPERDGGTATTASGCRESRRRRMAVAAGIAARIRAVSGAIAVRASVSMSIASTASSPRRRSRCRASPRRPARTRHRPPRPRARRPARPLPVPCPVQRSGRPSEPAHGEGPAGPGNVSRQLVVRMALPTDCTTMPPARATNSLGRRDNGHLDNCIGHRNGSRMPVDQESS